MSITKKVLKAVGAFLRPVLSVGNETDKTGGVMFMDPEPGTAYCFFGDTTKGGRPAMPEELQRLEGKQANGVPKGLVRCPICQDCEGECLDPDQKWEGRVMTVHCKCHAEHCPKCGGIISERKLNSNSYEDGEIWHTPWLNAMKHKCPDQTGNQGAAPCE